MRREVRALDPDQPVFNVRTMGDLHDRDLIDARLIVTLVAGFAVVALFLALVGFYGVLSYINAQRLREIGVRVALGAHRRDILGLVVGEGLRLTSIGVGIGLIGSFGLSRLLVSLLFEISPTDLVTFVGLPILMIVVAFVASYVVAARATRVDPVVVLRAD